MQFYVLISPCCACISAWDHQAQGGPRADSREGQYARRGPRRDAHSDNYAQTSRGKLSCTPSIPSSSRPIVGSQEAGSSLRALGGVRHQMRLAVEAHIDRMPYAAAGNLLIA
ncbi:hypothetical protein BV20DRAFT_32632 [Pilatotrama ljubarskyi]|nr:hypothetical protein BV20DRAFT_32632 [Pilatotrama ljubarskyi]